MSETATKKKHKLTPLGFTCSSTECPNGLHYFGGKRKKNDNPIGSCQDCGADLIDWERVRKQDLADFEYKLKSLKKEFIRHKYWEHVPIKESAVLRARRKGLLRTRASAERILRRLVGPANPYRDGHQTPYQSDDIENYGQHATACCCRKCIELWHGVPQGRDLTDEETSYLVDLVMEFVKYKLPTLSRDGEDIPHRRSA